MRRGLSLVWAVAGKDWALFWADRRAAALAFAVPVVLASGFGLVFDQPAPATASARLPLLVVAEADTPFHRRVVADLLACKRVDGRQVTRAEAERLVAGRAPGVGVVVPAAAAALAAWPPGPAADRLPVEVLHHPLAGPEAQWAEGVVTEVLMQRLVRTRIGLAGPGVDAAFEPPFVTVPVAVGGGAAGFHSASHSFAGMTLQYLLFWGMESGLALLRERRRSVWGRLRAAPVPVWALLAGRAAATAAVAFLQVLVTFAFGHAVFGVTVTGSWAGFLLLAAAASVLAAATGLVVAAVGGTEARARSVCILVILAVSLLGGLWVPAFVLPGWARDAAGGLPTGWAMDGFDGVLWQGRGLAATLPSVGVVAGFAAAFLAVAGVTFVSSEARRRRGIP